MKDYFLNLRSETSKRLFSQIAKNIRYNIKCYGEFKNSLIKEYSLKGNFMVTCTASEFIELKSKIDFYSTLYEQELEIFFASFITANDLLINPPDDNKRDITDLTEKELNEYRRVQKMASSIKKGNYLKQLN